MISELIEGKKRSKYEWNGDFDPMHGLNYRFILSVSLFLPSISKWTVLRKQAFVPMEHFFY